MTKTDALLSIEQKDWMRARTVSPNRITAMFNAITNDRKLLGRSLAFYYTYKYVLVYIYERNQIMREALSNLRRLVNREILSDLVFNQLQEVTLNEIIPYVSDSTLRRYFEEVRDNQGTGSNAGSHLGFFSEGKQIVESLFLSKDELNNKLKELKDEFPDKFEGASDEDILGKLKEISIDYLDGCTDLVFDDDNIVDITGNSTDILNQPAYKFLMQKTFEEVVDKWLEEHNLTHKDIVWFDYDPDTQQMFVEFDANNVDFDELEKLDRVPEYDVDNGEEELEESYVREALGKLEHDLYNKFKENEIFVDDLFFEDPEDEFDIKGLLKLTYHISGDWKHDHLFSEKLVEEFAGIRGWKIINYDEKVTEDSPDDSYAAYHYYVFLVPEDKLGFFKEDFVNEETLDETYSEEELDELVGKTFNQQKIQNIYRRNKYNDKRLFAHTRCVKCGREKRVFLSNLINDPEKYGSCVCSNTNVESRLDNIEDLFSGQKKLSSNTSGYTGVSYIKTYKGEMYDKWRAYIEVDGKRTYLGDFDSKSAAIRARKKAAEKGLKWYKEHKNEFMKNYRRRSKRYRSKK